MKQRERRVSWIWYWAILDRESEGFIASIPDLGDLAAYGENEKDAVARSQNSPATMFGHLWKAVSRFRARHASEMPNALQAKIGRAMISVKVG